MATKVVGFRIELEGDDELSQDIVSLTKQLKILTDQKKKLDKELKNDSGKKSAKDLEKLNKEIAETAINIKATRGELTKQQKDFLKIRDAIQATSGSYNDFVKKNQALRAELKALPGGFDKANKRANELKKQIAANTVELKKFDASIGDNFRNVGNYGKALSGLGTIFGALGVSIGLSGIVAIGKQIIKLNADLSDSIADVQKTTGLTAGEVDNLVNSFKKFDTRTSIEGLLGIAEAAGRMGIAAEDIQSFTLIVDKAFVALGDELTGTAEEIATDLAKIADVFDITEEFGAAEGINKLGSAINQLGSETKAQSAFLVDFSKRLTGAREITNISATDILGLAATLDELGQSVEVSGTSVSQILTKLASNTKAFAQAAGVDLEEFTDLVNTDINEALIVFAEGVNEGNLTTTSLTQSLKKLGLDGAKSTAIIGALSKNTDKLRENQELANDAFEKGTSLSDEFNIKNNTLAANIEKLFNNISQGVTDSGLIDFLNNVVGAMVDTDSASEKLRDRSKNLNKELDAQERALDPLVKRYDELKGQTELNEVEQEELRQVIEQIAEIVPTAASEIDEYGRVLDINTDQVKANTETQRELQQILGEKAVEEARDEIEDLNKSLARQVSIFDDIKDGVKEVQTISKTGTIRFSEVKVTNDEIRDQRQRILEVKDAISTQIEVIESLNEELTEEEKLLKRNVGGTIALSDATKDLNSENLENVDLTTLSIKELTKLIKQKNEAALAELKRRQALKDETKELEDQKTAVEQLEDRIKKLNERLEDQTLKGKINNTTLNEYLNLTNKLRDSQSNLTAEINEVTKGLKIEALELDDVKDVIVGLGSSTELVFEEAKTFVEKEGSFIDKLLGIDPESTTERRIKLGELKEELIAEGLEIAQQVSDGLFDIKQQNIQKENDQAIINREEQADDQIKILKDQLDEELLNQNLSDEQKLELTQQFDEQKLAIETSLQADVDELNREAAKKEQNTAAIQAAINGALAITKTIAQLGGVGVLTPVGIAALAGIVASTIAEVAFIKAQPLARGADFVTDGPELLLVGDNPGGKESVKVTPLSSPNINGPQPNQSFVEQQQGSQLDDSRIAAMVAEAFGEIRVVVSEAEITNTQNAVRVIQDESGF